MVQWLGFHAPNEGDPALIPGQGTRSHMLQLRPDTVKKKKKQVTWLKNTGTNISSEIPEHIFSNDIHQF